MIDSETIKLIGQVKEYRIEPGLSVSVKIEKLKEAYGNLLCLIVPINGRGSKWTRLTNLS